MTANDLSTILGEPVAAIVSGEPILASGEPLTAAQRRAIAPLRAEGVPEWDDDEGYAAAVTFEASRRNDALIPRRDRELLYLTALTSLADAVDALAAGDPLPESYGAAKTQGLAVAAAVQGIEGAAAQIAALTGESRPADYLALVAAFDAALNS